jgi:hypothetical protein
MGTFSPSLKTVARPHILCDRATSPNMHSPADGGMSPTGE